MVTAPVTRSYSLCNLLDPNSCYFRVLFILACIGLETRGPLSQTKINSEIICSFVERTYSQSGLGMECESLVAPLTSSPGPLKMGDCSENATKSGCKLAKSVKLHCSKFHENLKLHCFNFRPDPQMFPSKQPPSQRAALQRAKLSLSSLFSERKTCNSATTSEEITPCKAHLPPPP